MQTTLPGSDTLSETKPCNVRNKRISYVSFSFTHKWKMQKHLTKGWFFIYPKGVMTHLAFIRPRNDLGHPLCGNVREGDWLMDYLVSRLRPFKSCSGFADLLHRMFEPVRGVPHYLKPCYFDAVVTALFTQLLDASWKKMSRLVDDSYWFVISVHRNASFVLHVIECVNIHSLMATLQ